MMGRIYTRVDELAIINKIMSKLQAYIEINKIQRLTESEQDELALMVADRKLEALEEWCKLNEVDMKRVWNWANKGAKGALAAAGIAGSLAGSPAQAGDDIPDYIRKKANQTPFAQQSQQSMTRGQDPRRINQGPSGDQQHWNQHGNRSWDDDNQRWHDGNGRYWQDRRRPRTGVWFNFGNNYQNDEPYYDSYYDDPYAAVRQMNDRLMYSNEYESGLGGPGAVPPDPPQDGSPVDVDSSSDGDAGEGPSNEPMQDVPSKTIMYNMNGKQVAFQPYPTPIELARARQIGAFNQKVTLKNQPEPADALVWEDHGIMHVLLLPKQ